MKKFILHTAADHSAVQDGILIPMMLFMLASLCVSFETKEKKKMPISSIFSLFADSRLSSSQSVDSYASQTRLTVDESPYHRLRTL